MNHVQINGDSYRFADNWNDLTPRQLKQVVTVLYSNSNDRHHQRLRLLCVLLDVPLPYVLSVATPEQQIQLCRLTNFLLEGNELVAQLVPLLHVPLGKLFRSASRKHYGPREYLRNVTFAEFIYADTYVARLGATNDEAFLDKLVAVLYRPQRAKYKPNAPDFGGDRREDFNEHLVAGRAQQMARLDRGLKLAVLTWYRGCRTYLEQAYPLVFSEGNEAEASNSDWGTVLRAMAGKQFGNHEQTERTNLHTILHQMQDDALAAEKIREHARQHQP